MPIHVADHFAAGRHHQGVFTIGKQLGIGQMVYQLTMFRGASEAGEWIEPPGVLAVLSRRTWQKDVRPNARGETSP
jgi:hypothetical protein